MFKYKDAEYRAKEIKLLLDEGRTSKEIVDILGYSSVTALSNAKKKFGLQYQRRNKPQTSNED